MLFSICILSIAFAYFYSLTSNLFDLPITYANIISWLFGHKYLNLHCSYTTLFTAISSSSLDFCHNCGLPRVLTLWSIHTVMEVILLKCRFDHISLKSLSLGIKNPT